MGGAAAADLTELWAFRPGGYTFLFNPNFSIR